MRIERIRLDDYFNLPNPGLINYLDRLKIGQPEVYRTPFWNKANMSTVVAEWMKVVKSSDLDRLMPGLAQVELEQAKKVGPYSVIPPSAKRMASLYEYWEPVRGREPISQDAIKAVKQYFKPGGLKLWSREQVLAEMRLNTNSGPPYFTRRRIAAEKYRKNGYAKTHPYIAVWGTRVQPGGPSIKDEKVRSVWMMPMLLNIFESQYYYPLIQYEQEENLPFSIKTLRDTEERVTRLFDSKGDNLVINTDFSSFDQTFRAPLQDAAYDILTYAFSKPAHNIINDTFKIKYDVPLLIDKEHAIFGSHGMGSGATGTNPDENLAHKSLQFEAAQSKDKELNPFSQCLGDDGILSFNGIDIQDVIDSYTKHGLNMNESKQYVSRQSAKYLQRYYHVSYRDKQGVMLSVYSTFRALGRLLGQERFYDPELWNEVNVELRALQIIENCNNHPLFEKFIDFVKKGDKYGLGTKIPGFASKLQGAYDEYKANFNDMSYTQQNEQTSITDWKVVKYLFG